MKKRKSVSLTEVLMNNRKKLTTIPMSHPDPAGLAGHMPSLLTITPPFVVAHT